MPKPTEYNIVLFWFMNDWGKYGRTYEKIIEQLTQRPEVKRLICVLPPEIGRTGKNALPIKVYEKTKNLWVLSQNFRTFSPTSAPYKLRKWLNKTLPIFCLKLMLKFWGFKKNNTILWLYPPHPYIDKLKELIPHQKIILQIIDNNSFIENESEKKRREISSQYKSLAYSADEIIVSSEINYQIFYEYNKNCYQFENAIDKQFLQEASSLPQKTPFIRPRIGYVGWLTKRTDFELLTLIAHNRPEYDLILAGPLGDVDIKQLLALPNVFWLNRVPYEDVPQLLSTFDACLITHLDNLYSRSMSPLKLFQYLGSGRPIITTEVAGVQRWKAHVQIAKNHDDFLNKIDYSLKNETILKAKNRIKAVSNETWEVRIEQILEKVLSTTNSNNS